MNFDPDVQIILDMIRLAGRPAFDALTPDEARQAYMASREVLGPEPDPDPGTAHSGAVGIATSLRCVCRGTCCSHGRPT